MSQHAHADNIREFCLKQREWLKLELESDLDQEAEAEVSKTPVLTRLESVEISLGLYGRTVVSLGLSDNALLPSHKFTAGDEVEIRDKTSKKQFPSGVVSQVADTWISIALFEKRASSSETSEEGDVLGNPPFAIVPKSSVEVHRKMTEALQDLERNGLGHPIAGAVVRAAMSEPTQLQNYVSSSIKQLNSALDASQVAAIEFCLGSRPVSLVHGPPGTGKTTTVVELIKQAVNTFKMKVLVAAPSNVAVDNVLAKLVQSDSNGKSKRNRIRAVRLGHPARLHKDILPYSLEALVQAADGTEIVKDVRQELESFVRIASNPKSKYGDRRVAYREIKSLRKEVRSREEKVVQSLLANSQVVLATCVGAANKVLKDVEFDLVVIDEAAQALEAACWIPALRGKKLVLAGDHCQLPPTIKSKKAGVQKGLACTMFERVMALYGDNNGSPNGTVSRMLQVQYRMNHQIANWASKALYNDNLQTAETIKNQTISQLAKSSSDEDGISEAALWLVDTAGCSLHESVTPSGSKYNEGEASLVEHHVNALLEIGVQADQIAVISPYNGQVDLLKSRLLPIAPKLEIRSVDGFQGGEREAVVLSLVRSSDRGGKNGIGFLGDNRRLNVAVTRAKRHCCVICDSDTVSQSSFIKTMVQWFVEHGEVRSALEYTSETTADDLALDLLQAATILDGVESDSRSETKAPISQPKSNTGMKKTQSDDLIQRITKFANNGKPGESITLSSELSSADRRTVHETAERLGIDHESKGIDGVNRRITLSIAQAKSRTSELDDRAVTESEVDDDKHEMKLETPKSSFLGMDEVASSSSSENEDTEPTKDSSSSVPAKTDSNDMNSVLSRLAQERKERQQLKQQSQLQSKKDIPQKSKKKKKKGQKLGGAQRPAAKKSADQDELDNIEDDMAFLDAQIEKVQNSHGRVVHGKGKKYRSIVNGMLVEKPKSDERVRDSGAAAALQSKLKQAQKGRQTKIKKKK